MNSEATVTNGAGIQMMVQLMEQKLMRLPENRFEQRQVIEAFIAALSGESSETATTTVPPPKDPRWLWRRAA